MSFYKSHNGWSCSKLSIDDLIEPIKRFFLSFSPLSRCSYPEQLAGLEHVGVTLMNAKVLHSLTFFSCCWPCLQACNRVADHVFWACSLGCVTHADCLLGSVRLVNHVLWILSLVDHVLRTVLIQHYLLLEKLMLSAPIQWPFLII